MSQDARQHREGFFEADGIGQRANDLAHVVGAEFDPDDGVKTEPRPRSTSPFGFARIALPPTPVPAAAGITNCTVFDGGPTTGTFTFSLRGRYDVYVRRSTPSARRSEGKNWVRRASTELDMVFSFRWRGRFAAF
jgi:hypothetical protein